MHDFTGDAFRLKGQGSCPPTFAYDGLGASGTAVVTHRYVPGTTPGEGAFVLNANPAAHWNTILSSVVWEHIVEAEGSPPGPPGDLVAGRILQAVLPPGCAAEQDPTDIAAGPRALPPATRLHPNYPNPFNPTTTIAYDLPQPARVRLVIYDVSGRKIRDLVDADEPAGHRTVIWDARNASNEPVASGVYFYRLFAGDFVRTRKMVLLK